jgi:hypothetical protein
MKYLAPTLCELGSVRAVVLGTASDGQSDMGVESIQTLFKAEDIVAGLDE